MSESVQDSITKHESILTYIESLKTGTKISVRKIAQTMNVSEGTAYRAIKEAENRGIVSTRERIGTVRVERKQRQNIDKLTFAEVVGIVEGDVLGGASGLQKTLHKFVIGAMQQDAMVRYIEPGSLLIVGNRHKAHSVALEVGAGVLVTGGFGTSDDIVRMADELELPIISSSYDTFTVASMINRAIYDRLIKKKIMLVEDIIRSDSPVYTLKGSSTVTDWRLLSDETGNSRFPVLDDRGRVIGVITSKDIIGAVPEQTMDKLMSRNLLTVSPHTSIASAAHMMIWEGIEILPVMDENRKLINVITRSDVLKAMQYIQKQPQNGDTFEHLIWSEFEEVRDEQDFLFYRGTITPQMTNHLGTVSEGILTTLMSQAAYHAIQDVKKGDMVMDNLSAYFLKPVQIDSSIQIRPKIIEMSRKFSKVDVEIYHAGNLVGKSLVTAQMIDPA